MDSRGLIGVKKQEKNRNTRTDSFCDSIKNILN